MLSTVAMGHDSAPVLRYFREWLAVDDGFFSRCAQQCNESITDAGEDLP